MRSTNMENSDENLDMSLVSNRENIFASLMRSEVINLLALYQSYLETLTGGFQ